MTNNWTNFLNNRTAIVSDIEGYIPKSQLEKIKENIEKQQLIFLGDLFDYTTIAIDVREKPERCCALQLLKLFVDNPNSVRCVMGNRDINKIKMAQLCQFNNKSKWWKKDTEKLYGKELIDNYAKQLIELNDKKTNDLWLVDGNNFKQLWPYWNDTNPNISNWKGLKLDGTLYNRYISIFGVDPSDGTMSAQNTANGICCEIFGKVDDNNEYKAAVVFVVFARLLDPELYGKGNWEYDGLLYKYLTETPTIAYAEFDNMIMLFSHGGVESTFSSDISKFKNETVWNKVKSKYTQTGGVIETLESTNNFNQELRKMLDNVFNKVINNTFTSDIDMDIQVVNSLGCAIFNSDTIKRLNAVQYQKGESPIQSSIMGVINDTGKIMNTSKNMVNIFGHMPTGIGYTFGYNRQNGNYICCDYSMSLFKNKFELVDITYDNNYLVLYFNAGIFFLEGELNLISRGIVTQLKSNMESMTKDDNMKIFIHENTNIKSVDIESKPLNIKYNTKLNINYNGPYYYHGIANVNGTSDISIYSMMGPITHLFPKTIILQKNVSNLSKLYNKHGGGKHEKRKTKNKKKSKKQKTIKQKKYNQTNKKQSNKQKTIKQTKIQNITKTQ
jgi:hypothetical protein